MDASLGDNFDGIGFVRGLRARGHELAGRRVLIVGSGGAGRAVAHAVLDENPASIRLFDVDRTRAEDVVGRVAPRLGGYRGRLRRT